MNAGGASGLGVFGSLSAINSPIASTLKMYGVAAQPRNASQVFARCSQQRRAAQLTTAGAVSERSPAITPIRKANRYSDMTNRLLSHPRRHCRLRGRTSQPESQQVIVVEHVVAALDKFESRVLEFVGKRAFSGPHHFQDELLGNSLDPFEVDQHQVSVRPQRLLDLTQHVLVKFEMVVGVDDTHQVERARLQPGGVRIV